MQGRLHPGAWAGSLGVSRGRGSGGCIASVHLDLFHQFRLLYPPVVFGTLYRSTYRQFSLSHGMPVSCRRFYD